MTSEPVPPGPRTATSPADAWRFLALAARLLLEYNVRSQALEAAIDRIARHLGVDVHALAGYREVTLASGDGRGIHLRAPELRINVAVSLGVQRVIDDLCGDRIGLSEAITRLEAVEREVSRHRRWVVLALFGLAASAIAWLLLADRGAIAASGAAASLGLFARQELARRSVLPYTQVFTAGLIGAAVGGLAIQLGWTATPGLCLIVPALMIVPGPHLINGVHDMLENHIQTGMCRLGLATGVLMATALGVVLGAWLARVPPSPLVPADGMQLALPQDVVLAGVAACGFGAFYNAPWRVLWVSILCGMVGHGLRYLCLQQGFGIVAATMLGCLAVGLMADMAANRWRLPFPAVAFAGAVPMMPGVLMYQAIAGAIRLSASATADPALAATILAHAVRSVLVVTAMVTGLLAGARVAGLGTRHG